MPVTLELESELIASLEEDITSDAEESAEDCASLDTTAELLDTATLELLEDFFPSLPPQAVMPAAINSDRSICDALILCPLFIVNLIRQLQEIIGMDLVTSLLLTERFLLRDFFERARPMAPGALIIVIAIFYLVTRSITQASR